MVGDPGHDGRMMVLGRGIYDSKAVNKLIVTEADSTNKIDGVTVNTMDRHALLMPVSDKRFAVIAGEDVELAPAEGIVGQIKGKKSSL